MEDKNYVQVLDEIDRAFDRSLIDIVLSKYLLNFEDTLNNRIKEKNLSDGEGRIILDYVNVTNNSLGPFHEAMESYNNQKAFVSLATFFASGALALVGSYYFFKTGAEFFDINLTNFVGVDPNNPLPKNTVELGLASYIGISTSVFAGLWELIGGNITEFIGWKRPDYDELTGLSKDRENTLKKLEDL